VLSQSFHSIQIDESLACLFFLVVYAATSNRGCLPGKAVSGGTPCSRGQPTLHGDAVMSDAFGRTGRKQTRVPPSWKVTLGEEAVFAEVARVEPIHAAMPATRSCHGEKATLD
jgi:hypothetical protein